MEDSGPTGTRLSRPEETAVACRPREGGRAGVQEEMSAGTAVTECAEDWR